MRVERALGAWFETWSAGAVGVCEATFLRGEQSEALMRLRQGCLEDHLRTAAALVDLMTRMGDDGVDHATAAVLALPDPAPCVEAPGPRRRGPWRERLAASPGAAVDEARDRLAEGTALLALGRAGDAIEALENAARAARRRGSAKRPRRAAGRTPRSTCFAPSASATRRRPPRSKPGSPPTAAK